MPLDDDVPATPEVVYALAKDLEEQMALHYCRWDPQLKMIGLRFSNVMDPSEYAEFPSFEDDPASRKWNLWSYIDARDGAQAVIRALDYQTPGFDSFVIANSDSVMSRPSADLMAEFFPDTEFRSPVDGTQSLISTEKATPCARLDAATLVARPRTEPLRPVPSATRVQRSGVASVGDCFQEAWACVVFSVWWDGHQWRTEWNLLTQGTESECCGAVPADPRSPATRASEHHTSAARLAAVRVWAGAEA